MIYLKISYVHSSISSTVLQKAIAFCIPNIILKYPGYENVKDLVEEKAVFLVRTLEEFVRCLDKIKNFQYNAELKHYFFDLKPRNIKHFLVDILNINS